MTKLENDYVPAPAEVLSSRETDEVTPEPRARGSRLTSLDLLDSPDTKIWWRDIRNEIDLGRIPNQPKRIEKLQFGIGQIAVDPMTEVASMLTPAQQNCAIFASLGFTNEEIGTKDILNVSANTVKTSLRLAFSELQINSRAQIASSFLEAGYYKIIKPGIGLALSRAEYGVALCVALGMSNIVIAKSLGITPLTVKKHLDNISGANNLHGRERIALAFLLQEG